MIAATWRVVWPAAVGLLLSGIVASKSTIVIPGFRVIAPLLWPYFLVTLGVQLTRELKCKN